MGNAETSLLVQQSPVVKPKSNSGEVLLLLEEDLESIGVSTTDVILASAGSELRCSGTLGLRGIFPQLQPGKADFK